MLRNSNSLRSVSCGQLSYTKRIASYRWRWYKKKGVVILLLWSFAAFSVVNFAMNEFVISGTSQNVQRNSLIILGTTIFFPLAGWLADVYFGRYKVVKVCIILMWIGAVLYSTSLVSKAASLNSHKKVFEAMSSIAVLLICIGLGGFQANIIQFSMDQLFDSSSEEIVSYIISYCWSFFAGNVLFGFASCICSKFNALFSLIFPLLLTLAVSSDFLFNHWLVKEPVTHNPLKLILKVLWYAVKNKHPRQRSAFTYWDDRRYSRIDLGKSKYGGPFTTEQVEDVKTFFRIFGIIIPVCMFLGLTINNLQVSYTSSVSNFEGIDPPLIHCNDSVRYQTTCLKNAVVNAGSIVMLLGIPLFEVLIFPILWKCWL